LSADEQHELDGINAQLDRLGFRFFHPDDEYSRYLRLRNDLLREQFNVDVPGELAVKTVQMGRADREELAKRIINDLRSRSAMSSSEIAS